jgi:gluconate 5-dehydrogenase
MQELFDLSGNVALCTGASSGIGRRMAFALSVAGSDVVLVGRHKDTLNAAGADIVDVTGGRTAAVAADLLDRSGLPDLVAEATGYFGAPTTLVNAAGINLREPYDEITLESWDRQAGSAEAAPRPRQWRIEPD